MLVCIECDRQSVRPVTLQFFSFFIKLPTLLRRFLLDFPRWIFEVNLIDLGKVPSGASG